MNITFTNERINAALKQGLELLKTNHLIPGDTWPGPYPPFPRQNSTDFSIHDLMTCLPGPLLERMLYAFTFIQSASKRLFPGMESFVLSQMYLEWLLHVEPEKQWYRDHFIHQVQVAAIGHILLDQTIEEEDNLKIWEIILDRLSRIETEVTDSFLGPYLKKHPVSLRKDIIDDPEKAENWIKRTFWIAALFHDMGYAYKIYHETLSRKVRDSYLFFRQSDADCIEPWIDDISGDLIMEYCAHITGIEYQPDPYPSPIRPFQGLTSAQVLQSMMNTTHSAPGALNVQLAARRTPLYFRQRSLHHLSTELAALAILRHDIKDFTDTYQENSSLKKEAIDRVKFKDDPLSAFLILCDHISEFGREKLTWKDTATGGKTVELPEDVSPVKLTIDARNITIQFDEGLCDEHFDEDKDYFLTSDRSYLNMEDLFRSITIKSGHL